ncbi:glutamate 5-kinase [Prochlorococcus sp. MIT 1341]|uniref:glutamate 5-kinase n=1 Tax=Prochlorococcus sp. MIT 1341 TaxID=3096221 RepID=UPI002A757284|nr:glutamate 5-kinase [Prochlorococcus sp. MIT 1341]
MSLWVIKIGTSLLRGTKERSTIDMINSYSKYIASSIQKGEKVVLVTSGAVGLGSHKLGLRQRPGDVVSLQATAAIGQGYLMSLYEAAMGRHKAMVAQILLTRSDLESKQGYCNASNTLRKLLEWGVMPVVNENDTVSQEELRFGDNDTLSALVASAINADQLILLTDIDRLYSSDPRKDANAYPITEVHYPDGLTTLEAQTKGAKGGSWGTGGITTKLAAARIATDSGITVHLTDGRDPKALDEMLNGSRGGTVFYPSPKPFPSRKSWLAHALKPQGDLHIDEGACKALQNKGASLLLVGVKKIVGEFTANQPVRLLSPDGSELARGLCSLSSAKILQEKITTTSSGRSPIVIHRDFMVITRREVDNSNRETQDPSLKIS